MRVVGVGELARGEGRVTRDSWQGVRTGKGKGDPTCDW